MLPVTPNRISQDRVSAELDLNGISATQEVGGRNQAADLVLELGVLESELRDLPLEFLATVPKATEGVLLGVAFDS
jgi:hypothetical protein